MGLGCDKDVAGGSDGDKRSACFYKGGSPLEKNVEILVPLSSPLTTWNGTVILTSSFRAPVLS